MMRCRYSEGVVVNEALKERKRVEMIKKMMMVGDGVF
jgi:hypothetical protein